MKLAEARSDLPTYGSCSAKLKDTRPFPYTSVMIEVNKRVYMDESTLRLEYSALKWMRWSGTLRRIYEFSYTFLPQILGSLRGNVYLCNVEQFKT